MLIYGYIVWSCRFLKDFWKQEEVESLFLSCVIYEEEIYEEEIYEEEIYEEEKNEEENMNDQITHRWTENLKIEIQIMNQKFENYQIKIIYILFLISISQHFSFQNTQSARSEPNKAL